MKSIISFISEKLTVNSKTKVNTDKGLRDLSNVEIRTLGPLGSISKYHGANLPELYYKSPTEESKDWDKAKKYFDKKSKPSTLVNTIKTESKLVRRWFIYVRLGWEEAFQTFREEIDKRGYYTVDELDKYILLNYNYYKKSISNRTDTIEAFEKYLEINNVKY